MAQTANGEKSSSQPSMDDPEFLKKVEKLFVQLVPYDPRFPNTNQTKNCQMNYIDYFRCLTKKDENYCKWYKNAYHHLCPPEWIERWDEQRENGTFPIDFDK